MIYTRNVYTCPVYPMNPQLLFQVFPTDKLDNNILFVERYVKHQDMDCLPSNNIQIMNLTTALDFENCEKWCTSNSTCGGIVVYNYACYMKDESCKNNLFQQDNISTLIKYET